MQHTHKEPAKTGGGRFTLLIRSFSLKVLQCSNRKCDFFVPKDWLFGLLAVPMWGLLGLFSRDITYIHTPALFFMQRWDTECENGWKPQLQEYRYWFSTNCIISVHQFAAFTAVWLSQNLTTIHMRAHTHTQSVWSITWSIKRQQRFTRGAAALSSPAALNHPQQPRGSESFN